ncbi:hypothetical protein F5Y12DRAFT_7719 [Xylaria sp. FL1777]|nr:hypothetical protein F5Y12DRAFT_7719 [Xylaria sp. FL1777]
MPFFFLGARAAGSTGAQMKPSHNRDTSTCTGPSPSLWPEPARPIATTTRRVQFNPASEMSSTAGRVFRGAACKPPGSAHTDDAISSDHSNTTRAGSGSTLPTSASSASSPLPRPIEIRAPEVFEPHYPKWHCYPPIHPTKFDAKRRPSPIKAPSFDPTDKFLQQSRAFQDWVGKKNAERIQLRHGPAYQGLVDELHHYQYIADHDPAPAVRTDAIQQLIEIKKEMVEERKKFAPAELQYIREIEKGWVTFVSIDKYEQTISRQRHLSTVLPVEQKSSLSKVERLLGSDGSCLSISSWTQRCQSIPSKMSYEEAGMESMDLDGRKSKNLPSNPVDKLPLIGEGVTPWPDRPYEILIPDWFPVAAAQGNLEMSGGTVEENYINLLNYISQLELAKSQGEYKEKHPDEGGVIVKDGNWDKNWHSPNPGWRHEKQRRLGGWWKCRKGPEAVPAENKCTLCLDDEVHDEVPEPPIPAAQLLDDVMRYIGEAMAVVAENDKKMVLERNPSKKPTGLEVPGPLVDESVKIWAHQENPLTTTELDTIPLGARQPWINYNPLRGLDDSAEAMGTAQIYLDQTAAENKEMKQPEGDEGAGKNKGKFVSKETPTKVPS